MRQRARIYRISPSLIAVGGLTAVSLFAAAGAVMSAPGKPLELPSPTPAGLELFEKNIRPLLVENCNACHNGKMPTPLGGLALDTRKGFTKGGDQGAAIVPGDPSKSLLIKAVNYEDRHLQMPPRGKLPADKIALLNEWVKMGAPWPEDTGGAVTPPKKAPFNLQARKAAHWAWKAPKLPAVPAVKNKAWVKTPVDNFILAKLEQAGIAPAKPADRRTLIRRVTFDLTGLPPTPQEVQDFVNDKSPDAYKKVVERLLASPRYGERWARHWLDLVRYAETDGHEFDFEKENAWMYRDYLIRAFNRDVPYDQIVKEHVAGDLLKQPRLNPDNQWNESVLGTGFWWLGEGKHSPVDLRDDQGERYDNMLDVFSKTFLGLSIGCARCHDHKFDAISTKDYYALFGYLQSSRYDDVAVDDPTPVRKAVQELTALDERLQPLLARQAAGMTESGSLAQYLLAARAVLRGEVITTETARASSDTVFENFDKATYDGWTANGNAFGDTPNHAPIPAHQGDLGFRGTGVVNTHSALRGGQRVVGDQLTGRLTSSPFTIQRGYIRFLVGGGNHVGKTCVNLLVDGKIARTVTGQANNRMAWTAWDVRDLRGKEARIEIVDEVTGPWGNIGVDEITFSDSPEDGDRGRQINSAAAQSHLDPERLRAWVNRLETVAKNHASDAFHAWAMLVGADTDFGQQRAAFAKEASQMARGSELARQGTVSMANFDRSDWGGWSTTGEAFGTAPTRTLAAVRTADGRTRLSLPGTADSGRLSDRLEGTLRSPDFKLEKKQIHFRMAGRGARVRLILDGFQLIRYPIYGGLEIYADSDAPKWYTMDVAQWVGHRGYLEFLDHGTGYIAVDEVLCSDAPPPPDAPSPIVVKLLQEFTSTPAALADRYEAALSGALQQWSASGSAGMPEAALLADTLTPGGMVPAATWGPAPSDMSGLIEQRNRVAQSIPSRVRTIGMADGSAFDEPVHIRGNYRTMGDVVPRRNFEAISGPTGGAPSNGSGRLELAEEMASAKNPLVARVLVNRVWQHHFAEGIVRTPDDFGIRGENPTHPELLDYLASVFAAPKSAIRNRQPAMGMGWSIKDLHRVILLSSAYQMSSTPEAGAAAKEPANKLIHRMPVRRLEGEAIRDAILQLSGRLDTKMYGPGVMPYLTQFTEGRGRPRDSGPLDGDGRRSVYLAVRRNFLNPMFVAFDTPIPFNTMGRRSVSTVPAQALIMMNNPFVVQQAEVWAKRLLKDPSRSSEQRIQEMYLEAFSRPATAAELKAALDFLGPRPSTASDADQLKLWTDLCHVLMNTKEFIFVN